MIRIISAVFRIRRLLQIEQAAIYAVRSAQSLDCKLNEIERPPTGDDYNELMLVVARLGASL
ncbi:hypothetical protein [Bradyrhizobium sp. SZCCHNS3053]|uniref:hypothetical protein n=1 Tax=Bradyrhizobium sp. SZCCHNS3053 TaxID=3057322 RepID=UPI00291674F5|nr:hypothetical protein [Bradyrhizobium sp. SZCCHNS3053]